MLRFKNGFNHIYSNGNYSSKQYEKELNKIDYFNQFYDSDFFSKTELINLNNTELRKIFDRYKNSKKLIQICIKNFSCLYSQILSYSFDKRVTVKTMLILLKIDF